MTPGALAGREPYALLMRLTSRSRMTLLVAAVPLALGAAACAPAAEEETATESTAESTADATETTEETPVDPAACAEGKTLTEGTLTIGTDSPAYDPWFSGNDPSNGQGFESAVAYAVAERLGFAGDQVAWVKVPFNNSYKPGAKDFDFDINQISITADRAEVVDFSDGYYSAAQAVIAPKGSAAAEATSLEELRGFKLGAQTGTTSLAAIRDVIGPDSDPLVFDDTNAAKQALNNGQLEAIVADLPTAFYITAVELPKAEIVGQFQPDTGEQEEFGMLFEKGNPLVECVNAALTELRDSGELDAIEAEWLSDAVGVPELP